MYNAFRRCCGTVLTLLAGFRDRRCARALAGQGTTIQFRFRFRCQILTDETATGFRVNHIAPLLLTKSDALTLPSMSVTSVKFEIEIESKLNCRSLLSVTSV